MNRFGGTGGIVRRVIYVRFNLDSNRNIEASDGSIEASNGSI